ncbi:DNA-3-methyladenine glycosylase family protein [Aestuariivirga sp.]|uniref:DNA-3-methyladenine glycosylase family protein n=1 Tax=Aestuariivirga sp. TaxID=2650926 RepID=UPI003BAD8D3C
MKRLDTLDDLALAADRLTCAEPRFASVIERNGLPPLRHAEPDLKCLLRIVTDQLISLKAGEAIWNRLCNQLGDFSPEAVLARSDADLRALGLSGAKARTFHFAARAFAAGQFSSAGQQAEEDVFRLLTALPGVGPWTASIFLLIGLRAADAWPAADLALQVAAQDLLSLAERPSTDQLVRIGDAWRPDRSTAALILWQHYRNLRRMPRE